MTGISYIYELLDPSTHMPFYVGKSDNVENRIKLHYNRSREDNVKNELSKHIRRIIISGEPLMYRIVGRCGDTDAHNIEALRIKENEANGCILLNKSKSTRTAKKYPIERIAFDTIMYDTVLQFAINPETAIAMSADIAWKDINDYIMKEPELVENLTQCIIEYICNNKKL